MAASVLAVLSGVLPGLPGRRGAAGRRLLDLVDEATPRPEVLLVDFGAVPDIDVSALEAFAGFDTDLREQGITLWLANFNTRPLEMFRRLPDAAEWERRMFREVDNAATTFAAR
jgi:sulfate permease, SulP family